MSWTETPAETGSAELTTTTIVNHHTRGSIERLGGPLGHRNVDNTGSGIHRNWWIPLAVGSSALVVVALVAAIVLSGRAEVPVEPSVALSSRIGLAAKAALVALGSDEDEFETARAELLAILDARRDDLPGESHATVTENLQIIEAQIAAISEELSRDPDNPKLARMLAAAYQRELELLQRAAALPTVPDAAGEG